MKNNKLIKRFSLLAISFFCLTATHVAAQDFVKVKNQSKYGVVVMLDVNGFDPISECMRKGDSFTFNLDEAGVKAGSSYSVQYEADYDCPIKKELKWYPPNWCRKRKDGAATDKYSWQRTTSTGTKKFVLRNDGDALRCALQ